MRASTPIIALALVALCGAAVPVVSADATSVPADIRAAFHAFDDPPTPMTGGAAAAVEGGGIAGSLGLDPGLAQSRDTPASSRPVWAVPGQDAICVQVKDPTDGWAGVCASTEAAAAGRLSGTLVSVDAARKDVVYGLAPDAVTSVTVDTAHGAVDAEIVDGFYAVRVRDPIAVEVAGARGAQRFTERMPAGS